MAVVSPTGDLDRKASATDLLEEAEFSRIVPYKVDIKKRDSHWGPLVLALVIVIDWWFVFHFSRCAVGFDIQFVVCVLHQV